MNSTTNKNTLPNYKIDNSIELKRYNQPNAYLDNNVNASEFRSIFEAPKVDNNLVIDRLQEGRIQNQLAREAGQDLAATAQGMSIFAKSLKDPEPDPYLRARNAAQETFTQNRNAVQPNFIAPGATNQDVFGRNAGEAQTTRELMQNQLLQQQLAMQNSDRARYNQSVSANEDFARNIQSQGISAKNQKLLMDAQLAAQRAIAQTQANAQLGAAQIGANANIMSSLFGSLGNFGSAGGNGGRYW